MSTDGSTTAERYGYSSEDIVILIDDESGRYVWPTRDNIVSVCHGLLIHTPLYIRANPFILDIRHE